MPADAATALVWDMDGTLADTWLDIALTLNRALREEGFPEAIPEQVRAFIGRGLRRLVERAAPGAEAEPERVEAVIERFLSSYGEMSVVHTTLYPGIGACLEELSTHPMAVASNKPGRFVAPMLQRLGIEGYFSLALGGDSLAEAKPHPLVLRTVAAHFGVPPASLWMIGDSAPDIESARAVGARVIACTWGMRSRESLLAAGPDHLVDHPRDIPALVRGP